MKRMRTRYTGDAIGTWLSALDGQDAGHRLFESMQAFSGIDIGSAGDPSLPEKLMQDRMRVSNTQFDRTQLNLARRRRMLTPAGKEIRELDARKIFYGSSINRNRAMRQRISMMGPGSYLQGLGAIVPTDGSPAVITAYDLQNLLKAKGYTFSGGITGAFGSVTADVTRTAGKNMGYPVLTLIPFATSTTYLGGTKTFPNGKSWPTSVRVQPAEFIRDLQGEAAPAPAPTPSPAQPEDRDGTAITLDTSVVQKALLKLGANPVGMVAQRSRTLDGRSIVKGEPDGLLGSATKAEFRRIAGLYGLPVTNIDGREQSSVEFAYWKTYINPTSTWDTLKAKADAADQSAAQKTSKTSNRTFSDPVSVKDVQRWLNNAGRSGLGTPGMWNDKTKSAVKGVARNRLGINDPRFRTRSNGTYVMMSPPELVDRLRELRNPTTDVNTDDNQKIDDAINKAKADLPEDQKIDPNAAMIAYLNGVKAAFQKITNRKIRNSTVRGLRAQRKGITDALPELQKYKESIPLVKEVINLANDKIAAIDAELKRRAKSGGSTAGKTDEPPTTPDEQHEGGGLGMGAKIGIGVALLGAAAMIATSAREKKPMRPTAAHKAVSGWY